MRRGIAALAAVVAMFASVPGASATFHLMSIQEVGQSGPGGPDYVVLQMYASGQNFVGGKMIQTYSSAGTVQDTFTFPSDVAQGGTQRTIYVARDDGTPLGMPDFVSGDLVLTNDGAVCFGASFGAGAAIDCVAYGAFTGFAGPAPSPVGTPAPQMPPNGAIHRSIAAACATLLEPGDDTNDSAADFSLGAPTPRNNATAPTETGCTGGGDTDPPQTEITKEPKAKTTKAKAKFKFRSDETYSDFMCKLDKGRFEKCSSPFKEKVDPGKHKFSVFAIDRAGNEDPSPAKAKFKRVER